jgi:hypothetical protein
VVRRLSGGSRPQGHLLRLISDGFGLFVDDPGSEEYSLMCHSFMCLFGALYNGSFVRRSRIEHAAGPSIFVGDLRSGSELCKEGLPRQRDLTGKPFGQTWTSRPRHRPGQGLSLISADVLPRDEIGFHFGIILFDLGRVQTRRVADSKANHIG